MSDIPQLSSPQATSISPESVQSANGVRSDPRPVAETSTPTFKVYKPPNSLPLALPRTSATSIHAPLILRCSEDSLVETLSDDYFVPTVADLKAAQATLNARTRALVDAPLQLRTTREAAEKAKRNRWPQTTIRVKFADQTQLENVFSSTDKIRSVYSFVRGCLRDNVKPVKFVLYQSPPKRELKVSDLKVRDLTLSELQLSPSSILLIRFEEESFNHVNVTAPLASIVLSQAVALPRPSPPDSESSSGSNQRTPPGNSSTTRPMASEKKMPKWLKLVQKK